MTNNRQDRSIAWGDDATPTIVGIVGVGAMGLPMAQRLQRSDMTVRTVDVSAERVTHCRDLGLDADTELATLAGADVVLAMVATGPQLADLMEAELVTGGHLAGSVLVVASTVGPRAVRDAAIVASRHGLAVVDAPVTGGVAGARAGTLSLFTSGPSQAVDRVAKVLDAVGTMYLVGERPGDGQAMKLVNQMLASIHLVAAGEALAFAERLGLDLDVVMQLLPTGAAASWMLADRGPRMIVPADERSTETQLTIFVKDSDLVESVTREIGARAPLTSVARGVWQRAGEMGLSTGDDSGVVEAFRH